MLDHTVHSRTSRKRLLYSRAYGIPVRTVTRDGYPSAGQVLLSYDASGGSRAAAAEVCRIIFGRTRVDPAGHVRTESGFIHRPGVAWVGQSVLVLPPRDADELAARIRRLGVRVALGPVSVTQETLERFRRPR